MLNPPRQPAELDILLSSARRIASTLPARRAQIDHERCVAAETIGELKASGLFRLLQPKRWGGFEANPQWLIDTQNVLAEHCLSTAWVFGVLSVQSFMLSLFDPRAQQDVWGDDGSTLLSSAFQPHGQVQRVDGGFRLSGQWPYSSGCHHAQWAVVGALVPSGNADGAPDMRLFLVPRCDYEIIDTWQTFGLRGTGSNDIRVTDAFIPEYRTSQPEQGLLPGSTRCVHDAALYRMPWLFIFTSSVASLGIGGARGALNAFLDAIRSRVSAAGPKGKADPAALQAAARTKAELEEIEATLRRSLARLMDCARSGEVMLTAEALQHRVYLTSIVRRCTSLVDGLMPYLGARTVFLDTPFTRFWLDLCAARAHPGNDPGGVSAELGKLLLADGPTGRPANW